VRLRLQRITLPPQDAEAARKIYRRCQQLFGDGCVAVVRKSADAARQLPRGATSDPNLAAGETDMRYSERHPSRFLQAADLPREGVTVTIDKVAMEEIGTGKDAKDKPVLRFKKAKKGLVLNATNDATITKLLGSDDDREWHGHKVVLFPSTTPFQGKVVDCVRVRAVDGDDDPNTFQVTQTGTTSAPPKQSKSKPAAEEPPLNEGDDRGYDVDPDFDDDPNF
jgi:hypothetical protein